jgi:hypothetical protein
MSQRDWDSYLMTAGQGSEYSLGVSNDKTEGEYARHDLKMREKERMNIRTLGTIAMICSPALFIEGLLTMNEPNNVIIGIASFVFMFGWICTNLAMPRHIAAGYRSR